MEKWRRLLVFIAFFAVMLSLLTVRPFVGLADNSDYYRVIQPLGFETKDYERFYYAYDAYKIKNVDSHNILASIKNILAPDVANEQAYFSTQFIFIKTAMLINYIVKLLLAKNVQLFDMRVLGVLYSLCYAFGLYLIYTNVDFDKKSRRIVFFILLLLIFCDMGYLLYFNSFFGEGAILASMLMVVGSAAWIIKYKSVGVLPLILFYTSSFLFVGAKVANSPIGVLLALFALSFLMLRADMAWKRCIISCSIALFIFSIGFYLSVPPWMNKVNNYNALFFGVLKDSPNPEKDIAEFGIDKKYAELKDSHGFLEQRIYNIHGEEFEREVYNKASFGKIAIFYIKHPLRLMKKLEISAESSVIIQPSYLGNYTKKENPERLVFTKRFSIWSSVRKYTLGRAFYIVIAYFVVFLIGMLYEASCYIKSKEKDKHRLIKILLMLLLYITSLSQFVIPIVGNGEADLQKHMLLFNACFDLMLIFGLMWMFETIRHNYKLIAILSAVFILIVFVPSLSYKQRDMGKELKLGNYVKLGSYDNKALVWQVINYDEDNGYLLWSDSVIECLSFDDAHNEYGSNLWKQSKIRSWLNTYFLKSFNNDELRMLVPIRLKNILAHKYLQLKEGGERPLYWTSITPYVDQNYEGAYHMHTIDKVFLLDVRQLRQYVFDHGLPASKGNISYWLRTPYFNSDSMVRVMSVDGLVYHKDAYLKHIGVVPALYIKEDIEIKAGRGTAASPYNINQSR